MLVYHADGKFDFYKVYRSGVKSLTFVTWPTLHDVIVTYKVGSVYLDLPSFQVWG